MKILLAVDGSEHAIKATQYLAAHFEFAANASDLEVLYVHQPVPDGLALIQAQEIIGSNDINAFYRRCAKEVLAPAEDILSERGIHFSSDYILGDASTEICAYASRNKIDLIVMGAHGHSPLASVPLGAVTAKVLAATKTPVLVIR